MTEFEKKVLKEVLAIPLGQVRTYKWIARRLGSPRAARAVGNALRKNPYPVIVPCHRVVACAGKPGGYSQGVNKKKRLLKLEKEIYNMLSGFLASEGESDV